MATIKINPQNIINKIKPMHAVGQPPIGGPGKNTFKNFHFITEIGAPYSRLHDVGGAFGGNRYVDIPNIFRNFDADVNAPASYDFTFTDALLCALLKNKIEPYFRLGVSIENQAEIKNYYIDPPKDYEKWASICEHIVAHYNEGWADGYHMNITYWEIWNEVDDGLRQSQMWNGTAEDYYRLYEVTSKKLKARFPNIKIGGYSASNFYAAIPESLKLYPSNERHEYFVEFFHGFMKYVKEHDCPLDYFSWHSYEPAPQTLAMADWLDEQLKAYDFDGLETHLNEWNTFAFERDTPKHITHVASMMLGMQNKPCVDMLAIYDARIQGLYAPLFNPFTQRPFGAYYALAAFNFLYKLKNQAELCCDTAGIYAVAAVNGNNGAVMLSNISGENKELSFEGINLDGARWYLLDSDHQLSWSPELSVIENNSVILIEFNV